MKRLVALLMMLIVLACSTSFAFVYDTTLKHLYDDSIVYVRVNAKPDGSINVYYYKDVF